MRLTALMMTLCLLLSLCPLSEATNVEDSLTVGIQLTKTPLLYPLNPQERDIVNVYHAVYDSLITIDDNYLPQPSLAQSWEISSNAKTWTFHLHENITFSDGTPLTANDVVATAQYILDKASNDSANDPGYYCNLKYYVSSISATDDFTVVIKAARKYYGLLYALTFPVLKASEVESPNPVGTGPYMVTSYEENNYLWLEYNPYYWQTQPQVKNISFVIYSEPKEVVNAYEYAQVDTIFTRDMAASQYKSSSTAVTLDSRTNQLETLLMNHSSEKLADVNVRKAIRYALDIDKIASKAYNGMVTRTDLPTIPGTWLYDDNLSSNYVTDLAKAEALLEESGWTDLNGDGIREKTSDDGESTSTLSLKLYVYEEPDNDVRVEAANQIVDMLEQIGISCTVTSYSMLGEKEKLAAGSFDLALASFALDTVPDPGFLLMKGNTGNYSRYKSDTMNDYCNELRTCLTQADYQACMYKIEALFTEDCPFVCLYFRNGAVMTRKMYTTVRDIRELELLRGIEDFPN